VLTGSIAGRAGRLLLNALAALHAAGVSPAGLLNRLASRRGLSITRSVAYADGPRRVLDVYKPDTAAGAPVVLFFYGGSWQGGDKAVYPFLGTAMARRGYVTIIADYRVYPEVRYPGFIEDGALAVRWIKDNAARFGGDPERLFVMGHSAGAHIAAMLAIDRRWLNGVGLSASRDIAGLIGIAGPYDFLPLRDETLKVIFGGANEPATQPITYVEGNEAPALLVTGDRDTTVDPGNASRLAARLTAAGSSPVVMTYAGIGHLEVIGAFATPLRFLAPVLDDVDAFIAKVLATRTIREPAPTLSVSELT
jgi:acetyl esterase/lipase